MTNHRAQNGTRLLLQNRSSRRSIVQRGLALGAAAVAGPAIGWQAASAQDTKLSFMHWGSLLERDVMKTTVKAFNDANPDTSVEQIYVPGDYDTKLNTLVAADDLPDVFYQSGTQTLEWAEEGRVLELTQYVEQFPQLKNRLPQSFFYFAPGRIGGAMLAGEMATLYYHKDLFDQAGVGYPPAEAASAWSWDQFVETAKLMTLDQSGRNATDPEFDSENIKQYGVTFPRWWICWYPLLRSNGGDITNEDGTQYALNSPEAVDLFQKLQDLTFVHHVAPTPTQSENIPAANVQLQTRRSAIVIDGQWALLDIAAAGVNFGMGVLPSLQEPLTVFQCNASAISATTENLDATFKFYLFHNDPAQNMEPFAKGLWMPLELKYYQDEEFIKQWTDNDAHPAEYRTAVIDYALNHAVRDPTATFRNFPAINSRIEAGLDDVWTAKRPAQEALDALKDSIQPQIKGKYPSA